MPTYSNSTDNDVMVGSIRVPGHSSVDSLAYVQGSMPTGITMSVNGVFYNPVILSQKFTSGGSVQLPVTSGAYKVKLFCSTGEVSVKLNDSNGTAFLVGAGEAKEFYCNERIIDAVIVTITTGTLYLTVLKA